MSFKQNVAAFGAAAVIAGVGFSALGPHDHQSTQDINQQRQEQQLHDASEADKHVKEQLRNDGNDLLQSTMQDELRPVEVRPAEHLPFRLP